MSTTFEAHVNSALAAVREWQRGAINTDELNRRIDGIRPIKVLNDGNGSGGIYRTMDQDYARKYVLKAITGA